MSLQRGSVREAEKNDAPSRPRTPYYEGAEHLPAMPRRVWFRLAALQRWRGHLADECPWRMVRHLTHRAGDRGRLADMQAVMESYATRHRVSVRIAWADFGRLRPLGLVRQTAAPAPGRRSRYVLSVPAELPAELPQTLARAVRDARAADHHGQAVSLAHPGDTPGWQLAASPNFQAEADVPGRMRLAHYEGAEVLPCVPTPLWWRLVTLLRTCGNEIRPCALTRHLRADKAGRLTGIPAVLDAYSSRYGVSHRVGWVGFTNRFEGTTRRRDPQTAARARSVVESCGASSCNRSLKTFRSRSGQMKTPRRTGRFNKLHIQIVQDSAPTPAKETSRVPGPTALSRVRRRLR
ncbi:hypothetical protein [Microtetraspora sp. NBRC 16547]|uniref:hypothetical protein n=1 Tax=Microtetraspora sp. NBRC 16547 TaxID=3030993 RepID=UPI002556AC54|nr:hypothetical protein [Microtetraspora sp. NBRC 16547]